MNEERQTLNIRHLHETVFLYEAEEALDLGWKLLKVLAKRDEGEYANFVLGWPNDSGSPLYPKRGFPSL